MTLIRTVTDPFAGDRYIIRCDNCGIVYAAGGTWARCPQCQEGIEVRDLLAPVTKKRTGKVRGR